MTRFQYKAYTPEGALQTGEIDATDAEAAKGLVYDRGLLPIDAIPAEQAFNAPWWQRDVFSGNRLPLIDTVRLTRDLATLLGANLSIDDALRMVAAQARSRLSRAYTERLLDRVLAGRALSDAIEDDYLKLPPSYAPMVRAGEASGSLASVCAELATLSERTSELRSNIQSALIYPAVLFIVAMIALCLIMIVLLPNLAPVFENAGVPPPQAIVMMLWLESFVTAHWFVCLVVGGLGALLLLIAFTSQAGRAFRQRVLWHSPIIGTVARDLETARLARVLGTLLKNGVSLLAGLEIAGKVAQNVRFKSAISQATDGIREGQTLSDAFLHNDRISPLGQRLISVGEQSGHLDRMLLHLADVLEQDLKLKIDRMKSLLTPALTIAIGLGVGGLILSIMNAILSVNDIALQ